MLPSQNDDAHLFHVDKKTLIFMIFNDFNNFMVLGPRFSGVMGPSIFRDFLEFCFMVWDLSRSVPKVFRTPGNPLINLFRLLFNSKCHFFKVSFFIVLPVVSPPIGIACWPLLFPCGQVLYCIA